MGESVNIRITKASQSGKKSDKCSIINIKPHHFSFADKRLFRFQTYTQRISTIETRATKKANCLC